MSVHVFDTMGTTASIRTHGAPPPPETLAEVEGEFRTRDHRFSLYREDSEASLIARGDLHLTRASQEFLDTFARANDWRNRTGGAFTAQRPDGVIDLSGIVKAEAVEAAEGVLVRHGIHDYLINVGGDGVASAATGQPELGTGRRRALSWRAGVVDPEDRSRLLFGVDLAWPWRAIATSGTAERGEHIWRQTPIGGYLQVTVLASDIVTADVLATAILSGGSETLDNVVDSYDIDVFAIGTTGGWQMTGRLRAATQSPHRTGGHDDSSQPVTAAGDYL